MRLQDEATRLVKAAVPYKYQGRDLAGMDCTGVMLALFKACQVDVPDLVLSLQQEAGDEYVLSQAMWAYSELFRAIDESEAVAGDLVLFADGSQHVNHIGVIVGRRRMCHARRGVGVVVEKLSKFARLHGTKYMRYVGDGWQLLQ